MLNIFSCACWSSVCHFWRNVYLGLLPIFWLNSFFLFFLILSCMNCFGILEINLFLSAFFANVFSHSVGYLFILFMVFFAVQNILSIIRSRLFVLGFMSVILGGRSMIWLQFVSVFCLFFIVSGLTCRSLIHLFLCMVSKNVLIPFFFM